MLKFSWKLFSFGLLFLGLFVLAVALLLNIKKLRNTDFYLLKVFLVAAAFVFPLNNIASDLMMGKLYAQEYFLSFAGGYVFFTLPNLVYFSRRSFVFGIGEPCVYITNLSDSVCRGLWKISLWGLAAAFVFSKIIYFLI